MAQTAHGLGPAAIGNVAIAVHLSLAVIILIGGPLQPIPQLRRRAPSFHRWNGRLYIPALFIATIAALYMVWFRGTAGDFSQHIGVSLDAILIMIFAVLAVRYAIARDFTTRRRWALRLFMVVSGVWFFRVGLMLWLVITHGPAGLDPRCSPARSSPSGPSPTTSCPWPSCSSISEPPIAPTRPPASQWLRPSRG